MALVSLVFSAPAGGVDPRGNQFIGFNGFSSFERQTGARPTETVLLSPVLVAQMKWNQLVASWNAEIPEGAYLRVEARAVYPGPRGTKWYVLGLWSTNPERYPRECVLDQKDEEGDVATDTLSLRRPAQRLQLRVTLGGDLPAPTKPKLKFLGISLTDTAAEPEPLLPNRSAWDRLLPVPEKSQMDYADGTALCSPATVSMLLNYWAAKAKRPALAKDVPEVARAVYDKNWKGTGNWSFNTAYAGSLPGMRAYVARLSDVSELEDWIAAGTPVGLSLCYDLLRGKPSAGNGHLVVLAGFTEAGDPIINDPGTREETRKVFPRRNLERAWAYSHQTVYLIYPESSEIPKDRFGHWDSWAAHTRLMTE
jgi:hypothetical protein